jgi:two-component system, NarL family, sensor histidine kinase UhpB
MELARLLRLRKGRFGLFWQVFGLNAALLTLAVVLLVVTPATVSHPITLDQLLLLIVSAAVALLANAFMLRRSLRPLRRLWRLMEDVDLLQRGQRLEAGGAKELVVVAGAFNAMLDRLEQERRISMSRSLGGQEHERRQLATDLHDQIGQNLTALLLLLQPAVEEAPGELAASLREVQDVARSALDEIGRITRQLRPTVLDDLGLAPALRSLCVAAERASGLSIEQRYDEPLPVLSEEVELTLYRVAQEALTNVTRHAAASAASLDLRFREGVIELEVADNGRGMIHAPEVEYGGIRGMRERALAVGGGVDVVSIPSGGTRVRVEVPVGVPA